MSKGFLQQKKNAWAHQQVPPDTYHNKVAKRETVTLLR